MKQKVILVAFIAVIAMGISFLYLGGTGSTVATTGSTVTQTQTTTSGTVTTNTVDTTVADTAATTQTTQTTNTTATAAQTTTTTNTSPYTDGTYTSSVTYSVPEGGSEQISVTATLEDGVVTALTISQDADKRESERYQSRFESSVDSLVIGSDVSDISLSRVGGASLTTRAFNQAIQQIETQATA